MIFALSDKTLNSSFSWHQNSDSDFLVANFSFIAESDVKPIKHSYCCDVRQAGFSDRVWVSCAVPCCLLLYYSFAFICFHSDCFIIISHTVWIMDIDCMYCILSIHLFHFVIYYLYTWRQAEPVARLFVGFSLHVVSKTNHMWVS